MLKKIIILLIFFNLDIAYSSDISGFDTWLNKFKEFALSKGVSQETINKSFKNVKFLKKVIEYDRRQPEFYEDTLTYIDRRISKKRIAQAILLYRENESLFNKVEKKFNVEKEILLSLWGIETNFGKYVGKMDIISSLATLSYDKRRSAFFSNELLTLLKLIDKKLIDVDTLYGSWAGAYGNFQFMPSTIKSYAIDFDNNGKIELKKSLVDSVASAANYINRIGWNKDAPCFYKVNKTKEISKKLVNISARNISGRLSLSSWKKKGISIDQIVKHKKGHKAALIVPDNNEISPIYLVFSNFEKILNWNRSLRFAITVCTLAKKIKDEI